MYIRIPKFRVCNEEAIALVRKVLADIQFRIKNPRGSLDLTSASIVSDHEGLKIQRNGERIGTFISRNGKWTLTLVNSVFLELSAQAQAALNKLLEMFK